MTTTFKHYHHPADYQRVSEFLIAHHQPGNADGNWLEPAWEYMHSHPGLDYICAGKDRHLGGEWCDRCRSHLRVAVGRGFLSISSRVQAFETGSARLRRK